MANNPKKRQKQMERRTARRKEKKQSQVRSESGGLREKLSAAAKSPALHCWMPDSIDTDGIGWVLLSRAMPNGTVAAVTFLVDRYCLGVKNVFAEVLPRAFYDHKYLRRMRTEMPGREVSPAEARKFIEQAVAYAHNLGFAPHADYDRAMLLFGDVDASRSDAEFVFGFEGKPLFCNGPNDSEERCRQILATLEHSCGQDGYDFLLRVGPGSPVPFPGARPGQPSVFDPPQAEERKEER